MPRREAKRIYRELTAEEEARLASLRQKIEEEEKDEILDQARQYRRERKREQATLQEAFQLLKTERLAQGLSLTDVEGRTGIARGNLSRLENAAEANPTIATLQRYAEALGKRLHIVLSDS